MKISNNTMMDAFLKAGMKQPELPNRKSQVLDKRTGLMRERRVSWGTSYAHSMMAHDQLVSRVYQ